MWMPWSKCLNVKERERAQLENCDPPHEFQNSHLDGAQFLMWKYTSPEIIVCLEEWGAKWSEFHMCSRVEEKWVEIKIKYLTLLFVEYVLLKTTWVKLYLGQTHPNRKWLKF